MATIKMTAEQTETYNDAGEPGELLMRELREQARALHDKTGETVEIVTADGIVADVAQ